MRNNKPMPSDFGIPSDLDLHDIEEEILKYENKAQKIKKSYLAVLLSPFIVWFIFKSANDEFLEGIGILFFVIWVYYVGFKWVLDGLFAKCIEPLVPMHAQVSAHRKGIENYRQALSDWEYLNLETGEGFWKALRGEKFEDALARLFSRRGVSVEKTKKTGDGGVDLILRSESEEIFVQCKGYAKPVPVAPIREIAGVCSRSKSRPVVAAVNGFTKGARECARELNVTLIDTQGIVRLARLETIEPFKL